MKIVKVSTEGGGSVEVSMDDLAQVSPGVAQVFEEEDVKKVKVEFEDEASMEFTKLQE